MLTNSTQSDHVFQICCLPSTCPCVGTDWDVGDPGAWSERWDGEGSASARGVDNDDVAVVDSVRDLVADDDTIGLLRDTPSDF